MFTVITPGQYIEENTTKVMQYIKTIRRHSRRQDDMQYDRDDKTSRRFCPGRGRCARRLVLVFGRRSLRFVEYSPGILLDRFIVIGVYALRFTGPHRLATTRFPRRRPFLSSFMRDSKKEGEKKEGEKKEKEGEEEEKGEGNVTRPSPNCHRPHPWSS